MATTPTNNGVIYPLLRQSELKEEALIDPVSKFRVSQPETLIDTDFEYGLQPTKWETLETVNNIPTFFSRNGDENISIEDVTTVANSALITVVTTREHSFIRGSPIVIVGLESVTAEGSFAVLSVTSSTQFIYRAKQLQTATRSIYDKFSTYLYPARVFQATQYTSDKIESMVTDTADQSKIVVTTKEPHGFNVGTSFILNNSPGAKIVSFDASLVDPANSLTFTYNVNTTATNPDGTGFTSRSFVPYAFQSKKTIFFNPLSAVATNVISLPSHGMTTGESVMYVVPPGNVAVGGLVNNKLYSVVRVDANSVSLRDYAQSSATLTSGLLALRYAVYHNENPTFYLTQQVNGVFTVTNWSGNGVIGYPYNSGTSSWPAYSVMAIGWFRPSASGTWTFWTNSDDGSYLWIGDQAVNGFTTVNALVKNGGAHGLVKVGSSYTLEANKFYPLRVLQGNSGGAGELILSFSGPSVAERTDGTGYYFSTNTNDFTPTPSAANVVLTTASTTTTFGNHALLKAYPVRSVNANSDTVSLWLNSGNSSGATISQNDIVALFSGDTQRTGFGLENFLPSSNNIYSSSTTSTPNYTLYYVRNNPVIGATNTDLQISLSPGGSVSNITSTNNFVFGLTWVVPVTSILEFASIYSASHGIMNNDAITYSITSGTGPSGLTNGTTYYAEVVTPNFFRLKSATGSSAVVALNNFGSGSILFTRTIVNPTANTIYAPSHDLVDGTPVTYSRESNAVIPGLTNQATYFVLNPTTNRFSLTTVNRSANNVVDIVAIGSGIHKVSCREAIDGNYSIVNVPSANAFSLQAGFNIPLLDIVINTSKNLVISSNFMYMPQHRMATGTPVTYDKGTNASEIGGLTQGGTYYVIRVDTNIFRLASSLANANNSVAVSMNSSPPGEDHYLRTATLSGEFSVPDIGFTMSGSNVVTCSGSIDFLSTYRIGDPFLMEIPSNVSTVAISTVDATNDIITTSTLHNFATGDAVWYLSSTSTGVISGLAQNNLYYVNVVNTTQLRLFNTQAYAVANTNFIDLQSTLPLGVLSKLAVTQANITSIATATDVITLNSTHGWSVGDAVIYSGNLLGTITGMSDGVIYYISVPATNQVKLHQSFTDAVGGIGAIDLTNATVNGTHTLKKIVQNSVYESTVVEIKATTVIQLADNLPSTAPMCSPIIKTILYPRADGYAMHRSFDGGVEIIPSINPDSQIVRQTKKYFRYQSGKGIQVSKAVNFSAPTSIESLTRVGSTAVATTKRPHRLSVGVEIIIDGVTANAPTFSGDQQSPYWNGTYTVASVPTVDSFTFTLSVVPPQTIAGGYPQFYVKNWVNSVMRVGLFDDQNGIFFEYDGLHLNCVRRNSVKQLAGAATVTFNSQLVQGNDNTRYTTSVTVGDRVVIKGQTYKIVQVVNDGIMYVQPPYRGANAQNVVITRTIDYRVQQQEWSIDKCDGNGPTGYLLDIHKIQMVYIDYSWYGAGKVRFGFKDNNGHVRYVHDFIHNNLFTEAYLRSGNLPGRYEVATIGIPTFVPALMHWGTSVIMDGRFDVDQAYLFTAAGAQVSYASGDTINLSVTFTDARQNFVRTYRIYDPTVSKNVTCYRLYTATTYTTVQNLRSGTTLSGNGIASGTRMVGSPFKDTSSTGAYLYIDRQPTIPVVAGVQTITAGDPTDYLPNFIPLISIRLSPSVDSGRPGALGSREIINRMQLILKTIGILTTHDCEIRLLLNGYPYTKEWQRVTPPSLSQLILHSKSDSVNGGIQVYSFRVSGGTPDTTGRRISVASTVPLDELATLGNSILAGDDVFPNGPDILTIGATVLDNAGITISTPFSITGRITWAESQA